MTEAPLDFIVMGLPRSGTTWLANWLTTDHTLCLHDPFSYGYPEAWPRDGRTFGISCTGAYMMPKWLGRYTCPIAIIERDPLACDRSLRAMGLDGTHACQGPLAQAQGRRFAFADLWDEDGARALWSFLLSDVPFDALRYRLLREMQVQPHMETWSAHIPTLSEVSHLFLGGH